MTHPTLKLLLVIASISGAMMFQTAVYMQFGFGFVQGFLGSLPVWILIWTFLDLKELVRG